MKEAETTKPQTSEAIRQIASKFSLESGAAIPMLQEIQNTLGYVSKDMMRELSALTGIPASELYGIVTFYSQFHLEPRGENIIRVCHGTACHLAGAEKVTHAVEMATGSKDGGTSPDGLFSVERVACLGCCSLAPVMMVNEEAHAKVDPDKVKRIIRDFLKARKTADGSIETKQSEGENDASLGECSGE